jgi:hypothetical protein
MVVPPVRMISLVLLTAAIGHALDTSPSSALRAMIPSNEDTARSLNKTLIARYR